MKIKYLIDRQIQLKLVEAMSRPFSCHTSRVLFRCIQDYGDVFTKGRVYPPFMYEYNEAGDATCFSVFTNTGEVVSIPVWTIGQIFDVVYYYDTLEIGGLRFGYNQETYHNESTY